MEEIVFQRGTLTQETAPVAKAVQKYDSHASANNKATERDKKVARELAAMLLEYQQDYAIGKELLRA